MTVVLKFDYPQIVLQAAGPVIITNITITDSHAEALRQAGQAVPPKVKCRLLVDTGAAGTVVKHEIVALAGLKLINANRPLKGIGVDTSGRSYMGRILFVSSISPGSTHNVRVDTEIMSGALDTDQIDGVIGRDVLRFFELTYDGHTGHVRMKYHRQH